MMGRYGFKISLSFVRILMKVRWKKSTVNETIRLAWESFGLNGTNLSRFIFRLLVKDLHKEIIAGNLRKGGLIGSR